MNTSLRHTWGFGLRSSRATVWSCSRATVWSLASSASVTRRRWRQARRVRGARGARGSNPQFCWPEPLADASGEPGGVTEQDLQRAEFSPLPRSNDKNLLSWSHGKYFFILPIFNVLCYWTILVQYLLLIMLIRRSTGPEPDWPDLTRRLPQN